MLSNFDPLTIIKKKQAMSEQGQIEEHNDICLVFIFVYLYLVFVLYLFCKTIRKIIHGRYKGNRWAKIAAGATKKEQVHLT